VDVRSVLRWAADNDDLGARVLNLLADTVEEGDRAARETEIPAPKETTDD